MEGAKKGVGGVLRVGGIVVTRFKRLGSRLLIRPLWILISILWGEVLCFHDTAARGKTVFCERAH